MTPLTINPELRDLLPPLSPKQFVKLESEILKDGCTAPLIVWDGQIVDGHHRYTICTKHNIQFQTVEKTFESMDDAKLWMWQNQNSRRNLSRFQRAEIALKMKPIVAIQSSKKKLSTLKQNTDMQNSAYRMESKTTRQILAEFADVSHDTLDRVEFLVKNADVETLNNLRWDRKGTSINREYIRLRAAFDAQKPKKEKNPGSTSTMASKQSRTESGSKKSQSATTEEKPKSTKNETKTAKPDPNLTLFPEQDSNDSDESGKTIIATLKSRKKVNNNFCCGAIFEPDPDDDFFDWITEEERAELKAMQATCPNRVVPPILNFTIQNIPEHKPDQLLACLYSLFKVRYREKLAYGLLRKMFNEDSPELALSIVSTLFNEFQNK